ncbi:MAG: CPBP family intramembrane metalloprotease [Elusimicrobia bacterium]|nr:CPBP family intramembrane metalloprotease [Elusimicrobiota bacterium]
MVTEKLSVNQADFVPIIGSAILVYLVAAIFLHSGPPEVLEFIAKCGFLIILLPFLKKIGITTNGLKNYSSKRVTSDFIKATKYFLIILISVIAVIFLLAFVFGLISSFSHPGTVFWERIINGGGNQLGIYTANYAFKSPIATFFYLSTVCVVAPIGEEIFFRRFLFVFLRKKHSKGFSMFISGIVFGGVHFGGFISAAIMGFILAYIYEKEEKLAIPIILHALKNSTAVIIVLIRSFI